MPIEAASEAVVAQLLVDTGKPAAFFDYVILDLRDLASITAAVESLPQVDRLCLNAGGVGRNNMVALMGATDAMVDNVLGHAVLSDGLLKAGKLKAGARIVYIGSEVTRTIWSFRGLLPVYWCVGEIDIEHAISRNYYSDPCGGCAYSCDPMSCLPVRGQLGDYKNSKIVGQLFYSAVSLNLT